MPERFFALFVACFFILFTSWSGTGCSNAPGDRPKESSTDSIWLQKGSQIVSSTFGALSTALQRALQEGGPLKAIQYCHIEALPLTDSMSRVHHAIIRRTSDKVRNPLNAPNAREQRIIEYYREALDKGRPLDPRVESLGPDSIWFAAPIIVAPLCLQCHGVPGKDIADETLSALRQYYPSDAATGYVQGEFRGIWSITFAKK
ncbi:MAG: hypothetical protein KatS3mg030_030 [Saprospiraceae bacterium]|nr:MAG: hypothetical protein KatS3mg030_030 [Saprospiraceae bacterium]